MITGYEAFCLYQSMKLHFTQESYDFLKYGGKSKVSVDSFENRKDKYFFYKLSRRLQSKDELINFLVANFVNDENCWVGNLLEGQSETVYRERQKVIQSLSYTFENDCNKLFNLVDTPNDILRSENGEYPLLLVKTLQNVTQIETFCILNSLMNFLPMWDKNINDTIRWPVFKRKAIKYTPFIKFDKTRLKLILKKIVDEKVLVNH
jgi:hypothetical protein